LELEKIDQDTTCINKNNQGKAIHLEWKMGEKRKVYNSQINPNPAKVENMVRF
jgi:hypothetical protein